MVIRTAHHFPKDFESTSSSNQGGAVTCILRSRYPEDLRLEALVQSERYRMRWSAGVGLMRCRGVLERRRTHWTTGNDSETEEDPPSDSHSDGYMTEWWPQGRDVSVGLGEWYDWEVALQSNEKLPDQNIMDRSESVTHKPIHLF